MEPFHERLLSERAALADKVTKLHLFLMSANGHAVSAEQRALMAEQYGHMVSYCKVLDLRLALLGGA